MSRGDRGWKTLKSHLVRSSPRRGVSKGRMRAERR